MTTMAGAQLLRQHAFCKDCGRPCDSWRQKRWLENIYPVDFAGGGVGSPSDVANAAVFFEIPEKTLERWYYDYVECQKTAADDSGQPIGSLGIDELSLKKSTVNSSW